MESVIGSSAFRGEDALERIDLGGRCSLGVLLHNTSASKSTQFKRKTLGSQGG